MKEIEHGVDLAIQQQVNDLTERVQNTYKQVELIQKEWKKSRRQAREYRKIVAQTDASSLTQVPNRCRD